MRSNDGKGFTITELLIAGAIVIMLFASATGAYLFAKIVINRSLVQYELDRDADIILAGIIKGLKEGAQAYGLRSSSSFTLPAVTELRFVGVDGGARRYYLDGASLIYESPTQWPVSQTVYAASADSTITLRFWEPSGYSDHETVGIYIAISRQVNNVTVAGAVSTYVNIRNLPK